MKVDRAIGTPGTALSYAASVVVTACWGAGEASPAEPSAQSARRLRGDTGSPSIMPTLVHQCDPNRLVAESASFALDRLVVEAAGVPSPGFERSP